MILVASSKNCSSVILSSIKAVSNSSIRFSSFNISINVSYIPAKKSKLHAHVNLHNNLKKNDLKVETNAHVKKLAKNTKDLENKINAIPKGDTGETGPQGPVGPKGDTGGMTSSELSRLVSLESSTSSIKSDISSIKNDISSIKGFSWSSWSRDLTDIDDCLDDIDYYLSYSLSGTFGGISVTEGYFGGHNVSVPSFFGCG